MSSSRSRKPGRGIRYPTQWSDWVWSEQYQRHYRSRESQPGEYEYEYEQPESTPRTPQEPSLGPNVPETDPQDKNYTHTRTADADDLAENLARTSLGDDGAPYPAATGGGAYPYAGFPGVASGGPFSNAPYTSPATYANPSTYGGGGGEHYTSQSMSWQNHIRTRDPDTDREEFDPHYKVHGAWQFKWGRIFKVLWAEPRGAEGGGSASGTSGTGSVTVRKNDRGKEMYAKVRRFVIIKPMEGHCICLPILTYSGQGVKKRGVHAEHHAIIYSGKKPVAFRGEKEKGLQMRSIKVTPDNPRHKLDDASRLNYAKTYTVEYNVKVWFIGKVSSDSEWQIRTDYNRVHPPLEIKGVRPSDTQDDTTEYAGGGTYGSGYSSYGAAYTSTPYTTYSQSSEQGKYENPAEGSAAPAGGYANSYYPASSSNAGYGSSSGGYAGYYGSSSGSHGPHPTYERQDLPPVEESEEQQYSGGHRSRGKSSRRRDEPPHTSSSSSGHHSYYGPEHHSSSTGYEHTPAGGNQGPEHWTNPDEPPHAGDPHPEGPPPEDDIYDDDG